MRFKSLGNTNEKIPELGLGTWKMGSRIDEEIAAIRKGLGLGMGLVDTAEMYANERLVGEAIEGSDAFIATKVSPHHFGYNEILHSCDESLRRLGVRQIDLYQLHWPNNRIPISETMRAMEELVDMGKIRHIGVSNFSVEELRNAQESMKKHEIVSNQVEYNLLVRDIEQDLLPYCLKNKITVIAYSPVARGEIFNRKTALFGEMKRIALNHRKTVGQVALNWVVSKENVVAIPKSSSVSHTIENAGASGWKMSDTEMKELEEAAESKDPLSTAYKPIVSNYSFVLGAYSGIARLKSWRNQRKRRTTRSSKK